MATCTRSRRQRQRWVLSLLLSTVAICYVDLHREKRADHGRRRPLHERNDNGSYDDVIKVYSPTNSTSNVAACIMVKNETLYLDEWMDFHIALGFSPIYIYDNSDDFELKFGSLHYSEGLHGSSWYDARSDIREHIRLIHFPTFPRKTNGYWVNAAHYPAFDRCVKRDAINSTYAALFDADEYLVLKTDRFDNVVDFMDHYCPTGCGQLSINWRTMGISGQKQYSPVPVTKRNVNWNPWEAQEGVREGDRSADVRCRQ